MTSNGKEREAVVLRVIEENGQDYAVIHVDELARLQARAALQPAKGDSSWTLHDAAQMLLRRILLHGYDDSPNAEAEWERDFIVSQGVVWESVLANYQPMKRRDDLAQPDKAEVVEAMADALKLCKAHLLTCGPFAGDAVAKRMELGGLGRIETLDVVNAALAKAKAAGLV